jgi:hypothetical protein
LQLNANEPYDKHGRVCTDNHIYVYRLARREREREKAHIEIIR